MQMVTTEGFRPDRNLPHVLSQFVDTPLLLSQDKAMVAVASVRAKFGISGLSICDDDGNEQTIGGEFEMGQMVSAERVRVSQTRDRTYHVVDTRVGKIAYIPVYGILTKRWGLDPFSGMTGYDGIERKIWDMMSDKDVKGAMLVVDSPGGAVAGCFDLCDVVFQASAKNGGKPIYAIVDEMACSAAYAIVSQVDRSFIPRTGITGSVGCALIHLSYKGQMENDGIKATVFRTGRDKMRGNPYEDMDDRTAARIQSQIDECMDIFVDLVARGRGLSKKIVRETEGNTYMGRHGVQNGFVSAVGNADQAWSALLKRISRR